MAHSQNQKIMDKIQKVINDDEFDYMVLEWDNHSCQMEITNNRDGTYNVEFGQFVDQDTLVDNKKYSSLSRNKLLVLISEYEITYIQAEFQDQRQPLFIEI